eukprot:COSAG06_NODE_1938_length_8027_cov_3.050959_10_plen_75_part_00
MYISLKRRTRFSKLRSVGSIKPALTNSKIQIAMAMAVAVAVAVVEPHNVMCETQLTAAQGRDRYSNRCDSSPRF